MTTCLKKNIALLFKFIDKSRTRPASFYFRFFIIMYVVVIGAIEWNWNINFYILLLFVFDFRFNLWPNWLNCRGAGLPTAVRFAWTTSSLKAARCAGPDLYGIAIQRYRENAIWRFFCCWSLPLRLPLLMKRLLRVRSLPKRLAVHARDRLLLSCKKKWMGKKREANVVLGKWN